MSGKGQRFSLDERPLKELAAHLEQKSPGFLLSREGEVGLPLARIKPASWNARRFFDPHKISELDQDLKEKGQIHAILVRPQGQDYEVVVGERRVRAAPEAGLKTLRARILDLSDKEAQALSLSENLSREDLNAYEETLGYLQLLGIELTELPAFVAFRRSGEPLQGAVVRLLHKLFNERSLKPAETGVVRGTPLEAMVQGVFAAHRRIGLEAFYRHRLPILNYPPDLQEQMQRGALEYSKAAVLAKLTDPATRERLTLETLENNLSVTALRARVEKANPGKANPLHARMEKVARQIKAARLNPVQQKQALELLEELERLLQG